MIKKQFMYYKLKQEINSLTAKLKGENYNMYYQRKKFNYNNPSRGS